MCRRNRRAGLDAAHPAGCGRQRDRASAVDDVLARWRRRDDDHAVHGVQVQVMARRSAQRSQQDPFVEMTGTVNARGTDQ